MLNRRGFITGLISFGVAAPAIVRAASLMPVKVLPEELTLHGVPLVFDVGFDMQWLDVSDGAWKTFVPRMAKNPELIFQMMSEANANRD